MKRLLGERVPDEGGITNLSPKLSAHLVEILAENSENQSALDTALSLLPRLRRSDRTLPGHRKMPFSRQWLRLEFGAMPYRIRLS